MYLIGESRADSTAFVTAEAVTYRPFHLIRASLGHSVERVERVRPMFKMFPYIVALGSTLGAGFLERVAYAATG